jgi:hypothetical protein
MLVKTFGRDKNGIAPSASVYSKRSDGDQTSLRIRANVLKIFDLLTRGSSWGLAEEPGILPMGNWVRFVKTLFLYFR